MTPRTRRNEFLADLVEFLQKHFAVAVDRTRIDDEGDRILIVLRHSPTDSRLEIEAGPRSAELRYAGAAWQVTGSGSEDALRADLLEEVLDLLLGRTVVVASQGGEALRIRKADEAETGGTSASPRDALPGSGPRLAHRWAQVPVPL